MNLDVELGKRLGFLQKGETTLMDIGARVGGAVSRCESNGQIELWRDRFTKSIGEGYLIPAGRIIRNIKEGQVGSVFNCYITAVEDDIRSIAHLNSAVTIISAYGGGYGCNFSQLRPEGDAIKTRGGVSTGPVSFMGMADAISGRVMSGGGRRAAGMVILNVDHPDIYKFIAAKLKEADLNNLNISVGITNEFLHVVRQKGDWDLKFNGRVYRTVKAHELWEHLLDCAKKSAEPGFINLSNLRDWNNGYYFERIDSTNPCGEIVGHPWSTCALSNINLHQLVEDGVFNYDKLKAYTAVGIRFLDNIVTLGEYPLPENVVVAERSRRIGLGVIGFAHALIEQKIRYGSDACMEFIDSAWSTMRDAAYTASVGLAEERGYFPAFDAEHYLQSPFVKTLPRKIKKAIRLHGIRNVCLLSCPPTGDTGFFTRLSTGIEPIPAKRYMKHKKVKDPKTGEVVIKKVMITDEMFKKYGKVKAYDKTFVGMYDVSPEEHLCVQSQIQHYVDNSISKTCNVSKKRAKDFSKILLSHIQNLKGTTIYVEGSRGPSLAVDGDSGECSGGVCNIVTPV